ncbi:MAG: hypothetical protein J7K22_04180 [Nanoarchaeota archaeon]|nr:hypothetical protein [Nanoarchaeota archaeon]
MPIARTRLKETSTKRYDVESDKIKMGKLETNITITNLKELKNEPKAVIFEYKYNVSYPLAEPKDKKLGEITITGEVLYVGEEKEIQDLLKNWKKDKKVKGTLLARILNAAMTDAQIEAIEQSKKVGLPSPVPLLRFRGK